MREAQYINNRKPDWERLDTLIAGMNRKGPASLSEEELGEIAALYRRTTADLAYVQTNFPYGRIVTFLNALVQRAHAEIYRGEPLSARRLVRFFTHTFPGSVRRAWPYVIVAAAVFLLGSFLGGWAVATEHSQLLDVLPEGILQLIESGEELGPGENFDPRESPLLTAYITTNNIQVSFLAFALGVTLGIGTIWVLWFNGMIFGAVAWAFHAEGRAVPFWGWVAPHGAIEIPVIFIAAAAGLMIGTALVQPGDYRRRDALRIAAVAAMPLIGGSIVLLGIAGAIEGFFSPLSLEPAIKHATGASVLLLFAWYVARGGLTIRPTQRSHHSY